MTAEPDRSPLRSARWNPYLVGALIGLLSCVVFVVVDKPLGMSTAVVEAAGACAVPVMGADAVAANPYWAKHAPKWDYGTLFLLGALIGATVSAMVSGSFRIESVPSVWRERFGGSVGRRMAAAVIGGAIMLYGARLAGGCTSGHGISGSLQLAVSSWTFFAVMFASGIVTAALMFGLRSADNSDRKDW
jgi:uncharacterized membrane protein YedE/YeeE